MRTSSLGGTAATFRSLLRRTRDTGKFGAVEIAHLHMPGNSRGHCCNVPLAFKNASDSRYDRCRSQTLDELISMGGVACSDSRYDGCRSQTLDELIPMGDYVGSNCVTTR